MNRIEIRREKIRDDLTLDVFYIDGKPLYEYFREWECGVDLVELLAITWTDRYDFEFDADFMRYCLDKDHANVPILSCPDDFDFTCTVIVAEVEKRDDKVIWHRIGIVDNSAWSFEDERRSGVLLTSSYTDADWERFGDTFVNADLDNEDFRRFESEHGVEEMYRRRINHTFPYYRDERNIRWFSKCSFEFSSDQYDKLVKSCYSGDR